MKALLLSFLEPEGQGRGIVIDAPRLFPVKSILFRKLGRGTPKMMPHPLLYTEIFIAFTSGFQNHLQTRYYLHEKGTEVV